MMGYGRTNFSAATAAVANQIVASANMKVATAYTVANSGAMPTAGARLITCTRTVAGDADTPGTILVTGKDLTGATITDTLIPGAHGILVTGTKYFASVTSVQGAGWVIDVGTSTNDTIVVGCAAAAIVAQGAGTLHGLQINTAAAGAVTIADAAGTIAVVPSNQAAGTFYEWDAIWSGYLSVTAAAATDITVLHTSSIPATYKLS